MKCFFRSNIDDIELSDDIIYALFIGDFLLINSFLLLTDFIDFILHYSSVYTHVDV